MKVDVCGRGLVVALGLGALLAMPVWTPAQTSVYSNVVGFNRLDVPSEGLALVSTPFDAGTNSSVQEVVGPQMTGGGGYATADRIFLWDRPNRRFIRLYQREDTNPAIDGKWVDTSVVPNILATNEIRVGEGFWIQNLQASNQSVYVVGDVVTDDSITTVISEGLQMLSYPYSADILLNDSGLTNGAPGSGYADTDVDRLFLWDPDNQVYKAFYLREDANPAFHRKWIDTSVIPNQLASDSLQAGTGFWYDRRTASDFSWVENRPYPIP